MLLLSTACFPPLEYFVYLVQHGKAMIDLHETYPKQTWRNRYMIIGGNGQVCLTVPVEKPLGNRTPTNQVLISRHYPWKQNHWRSIHSAYRNAPFFIYYCDLIEQLIVNQDEDSLAGFNTSVTDALIREAELKVTVEYTNSFISDTSGYIDLRFAVSPKMRDRGNLKELSFPNYYQVFEDKFGFIPNASILDLLFNLGPDTKHYLQQVALRGESV